MLEVEYFRWLLPARFAGGKPYLSSWKMSAAEAAARGAIAPDLASREVRKIPEAGEPGHQVHHTAGRDGVR
jgi:hypothetical protein